MPTVAVLQKLLNVNGASISVDGIFGSDTVHAVQRYQTQHNIQPTTGRVGITTWTSLASCHNLRIVDCVDVFDESLYDWEATDLRAIGSDPILIGGMCNGIEAAVDAIVSRATTRNLFLLRFHGHGSPGAAGISDGHGEIPRTCTSTSCTDAVPISEEENTAATLLSLARLRSVWERLRGVFSPYGSVQFMHCSTGRGITGRRFLEAFADIVEVPVTAAREVQYGGELDTFRFEGSVRTAFPNGGSLMSWSQALPDFMPVCRPVTEYHF